MERYVIKETYERVCYMTRPINYNLYKIDTTEILIGCRPDRVIVTEEFANSIDAWLSVTESHIPHKYRGKHQWSPWNEQGKPTPEYIFSALKTLEEWVVTLKLKRVFVHCDAGSHRAPTIFGLFLLAYFPDSAREICDKYEAVDRGPYPSNPSNPLVYAKTYLNELKWLETLLPYIVNSNSLDNWIDSIPTKELAKYRWDREINVTVPMAIWKTWLTVRIFCKYNLFLTPINRINNFFHKKLNTKRGKWLKKHGF